MPGCAAAGPGRADPEDAVALSFSSRNCFQTSASLRSRPGFGARPSIVLKWTCISEAKTIARGGILSMRIAARCAAYSISVRTMRMPKPSSPT